MRKLHYSSVKQLFINSKVELLLKFELFFSSYTNNVVQFYQSTFVIDFELQLIDSVAFVAAGIVVCCK